jgi:hypothetical protein
MVNIKLNYLIEILMIICLIVIIITTFGVGYSRGSDITDIHHTVGIIFIGLLILHIILHFKFIIRMTKNIF